MIVACVGVPAVTTGEAPPASATFTAVATAGWTEMPVCEPAMLGDAASAAEMDCVPAVRSVTPFENVRIPPEPEKEKFPGTVACGSLEVNCTVPA